MKSESQTELLTLKWKTGHARDLDNRWGFCHCMSGLDLNCWPDSIRLRFSLMFSRLLQNSLANGIVRLFSLSTEASGQGDSPQWITFLPLTDCDPGSGCLFKSLPHLSWASRCRFETHDGKTLLKRDYQWCTSRIVWHLLVFTIIHKNFSKISMSTPHWCKLRQCICPLGAYYQWWTRGKRKKIYWAIATNEVALFLTSITT